MKITILTNNVVEDHKGGGELNNRILQDTGRERGHIVSEMPLLNFNKDELKKSDVVIISCGMRAFNIESQNWVLDNCKNVIRLEMDYGFCEKGNCECFGDITAVANCGKCNGDSELYKLHQRYLDECIYYVFLSPGHVDMFRKFYNVPEEKVLIYVPFYKSDKIFRDLNLGRIKDSVLWAGRFSKSKGLNKTMITMINAPHKNFFVCGKASTPEYTEMVAKQLSNIHNCTYLGDIDHDTMPHIYNLMEDFIFEGVWPDTGPTTVLEAALCGCNLITNNKVATILTNNFKNLDDIRTKIRDSKELFWNKIEEIK